MTSSTPSPTRTTTVVQLPAADVRVGDVFGTSKKALSSGQGQPVGYVTTSPEGRVQMRGVDRKMIRSCDPQTRVWISRTTDAPAAAPAPAPKAAPKATPKRNGNGAQVKAAPAAPATPDTGALEAEMKQLQGRKTGLTSKQSARLQAIRAQLGLNQGTKAKKAVSTAGRDDAARGVAKAANEVGGSDWSPASKITGPNIARLVACLQGHADAPLFGLSRPAAVRYVKTGAVPKDGLPWQLRQVGACAGADTFYGRKLVSMLVALDATDQTVAPLPGMKAAQLTKPEPKAAKPAAKKPAAKAAAKTPKAAAKKPAAKKAAAKPAAPARKAAATRTTKKGK